MAAASPTPLPTSFGHDRLMRQTSSRELSRNQPSRPTLRRNSPLSIFRNSNGFGAGAEGLQSISVGDSSDDEAFPVLKLSAASRAILGDSASSVDPSSPAAGHGYKETNGRSDRGEQRSRGTTPQGAGHLRIYRQSSPSVLGNDSVSPPRVVQIRSGGQSSGTLRRNLSMVGRYPEANFSRESTPHELITPAPGPRGVRPLRPQAGSAASNHGSISRPDSAGHGSAQQPDDLKDVPLALRNRPGSAQGTAVRQEPYASVKARTGEDAALQSSIRVKRVPMGTGTFLRGKPMRRPLKRQNSIDGQSPGGEEPRMPTPAPQTPYEGEQRPPSRSGVGMKSAHVSVHDFADRPKVSMEQRRYEDPAKGNPPPVQQNLIQHEPRPPSRYQHRAPSPQPLPVPQQPQPKAPAEPLVFKVPQLPPVLPSLYDQENEPPPTFKKSKPHISILQDVNENKMLADTPVPVAASPHRQALAPRSQNTPHRPAPPPPKMSILEAATAKAGASTVKGKKKRSHVTVNGQLYTLMDLLGRGGSSKVYQVLAPNNKRYALKRVNLEGIDEHAVMGYKGEIDLLRKLEKCERVVELIDWEISEEKMSLSVIMQIGDSDLNKILASRPNGPADAPKLDLPFVRHTWKEMLECVDAVHAFDIVHSDLKPANFVLVKGRLKLIDFGIANAIDIEHTVNVHRESNVGTPNYMSPESLTDLNSEGAKGPHKVSSGRGEPRLMKLGKPSDVWSLGCILYQMVYGKPPFAYIANQLQRILAITNPEVDIAYPDTGIGGVYVPVALKRTLKQCLTREPGKRPTAAQLLDERNAWLYPEEAERRGAVVLDEELLGRILMNVVERCRDPKRGCPTDEEVRGYPGQFLGKIRAMMEDVGWDR